MKYRRLDAAGDMSFGHGPADFLVNTPEAVAQAVKTRLLLLRGEWFLDVTEGSPFATEVLGYGTGATYDHSIRARIAGTAGVTGIVSYQSLRHDRTLQVLATIDTEYGRSEVVTTL